MDFIPCCGSNAGNLGGVEAEAIPWGVYPYSLKLRLPPLGALYFKRERRSTPCTLPSILRESLLALKLRKKGRSLVGRGSCGELKRTISRDIKPAFPSGVSNPEGIPSSARQPGALPQSQAWTRAPEKHQQDPSMRGPAGLLAPLARTAAHHLHWIEFLRGPRDVVLRVRNDFG